MPVRNFEPINPATDISTTRTFLHEVIPITGSIVSGTYSDNNIKNYTHAMFQSVYDYPTPVSHNLVSQHLMVKKTWKYM